MMDNVRHDHALSRWWTMSDTIMLTTDDGQCPTWSCSQQMVDNVRHDHAHNRWWTMSDTIMLSTDGGQCPTRSCSQQTGTMSDTIMLLADGGLCPTRSCSQQMGDNVRHDHLVNTASCGPCYSIFLIRLLLLATNWPIFKRNSREIDRRITRVHITN